MLPVKGARVPVPPSKLSFMYQRSGTHHHRGVDFPAPLGTPVVAAEAGVVVFAIFAYTPGFSGYGRAVVIHGISGRYFLYGHLDSVSVQGGAFVEAGQQIGTVGKTAFYRTDKRGNIKGKPHVHFEVSANPYPQDSEAPRLDPVAFLREGAPSPTPPSSPPRAAGMATTGALMVVAVIAGLYFFLGK